MLPVFKIVLVGASGSGKTALFNAATRRSGAASPTSPHAYEPTIGVAFGQVTVRVSSSAVLTRLWDTGGAQRFEKFIPSHLIDASIVAVVCDVTSIESRRQLSYWIEMVRAASTPATIVVVATKCDLVERRVVFDAAIDGLAYFETSARTPGAVDELVVRLADLMVARHSSENVPQRDARRRVVAMHSPIAVAGGRNPLQPPSIIAEGRDPLPPLACVCAATSIAPPPQPSPWRAFAAALVPCLVASSAK